MNLSDHKQMRRSSTFYNLILFGKRKQEVRKDERLGKAKFNYPDFLTKTSQIKRK